VCTHNQCNFSYVHKPSDMNLETRPLKQEFAIWECASQISRLLGYKAQHRLTKQNSLLCKRSSQSKRTRSPNPWMTSD
jgi:hypothetical protein